MATLLFPEVFFKPSSLYRTLHTLELTGTSLGESKTDTASIHIDNEPDPSGGGWHPRTCPQDPVFN